MLSNWFNFLANQSDQTILKGMVLIAFIIFIACYLFQWLRNKLVVSIVKNEINIWKGKKLIFKGANDQINYRVTLLKYYGKDKLHVLPVSFRKVDVELFYCNEDIKGITLNLLPWGYEEYLRFLD